MGLGSWSGSGVRGQDHLQRHLDEHQHFLDSDPHAFSLHLLGDGSTLLIREVPQELQ